jgi:hypothetical protein
VHPQLVQQGTAVTDVLLVRSDWTNLCSVFKRGDASVKDNDHGIAVGSTMGKLFSMVLEKRLSAFCEQNGFRASGQAGFRPDHRTSDNVFVLKHLIDKSRLDNKHMLTCFVDFRKAYDLVRRDLLMKCLSEIVVRDNMLCAIVSVLACSYDHKVWAHGWRALRQH